MLPADVCGNHNFLGQLNICRPLPFNFQLHCRHWNIHWQSLWYFFIDHESDGQKPARSFQQLRSNGHGNNMIQSWTEIESLQFLGYFRCLSYLGLPGVTWPCQKHSGQFCRRLGKVMQALFENCMCSTLRKFSRCDGSKMHAALEGLLACATNRYKLKCTTIAEWLAWLWTWHIRISEGTDL